MNETDLLALDTLLLQFACDLCAIADGSIQTAMQQIPFGEIEQPVLPLIPVQRDAAHHVRHIGDQRRQRSDHVGARQNRVHHIDAAAAHPRRED